MWSVWCGTYMSDRTYPSKAEAIKRAKMLSAMTGRKWYVKHVITRGV